MAKVISVSVPDELYARWEESNLDISPSSLFQSALETQLAQQPRPQEHKTPQPITSQ